MHSGELVVVGNDKLEIELGNRHPSRVMVKFQDHHVIVPCNPHHHDQLRWEVKNLHQHHPHDFRHDHCHHNDNYVLIIKWHVSSLRVIEWFVFY